MSIPLIDNFSINTSKPIDDRTVVNNDSERINITFKFDGLKVFQKDNRVTYVWNELTSNWDIDNSGLSKNGNENYIPIFGIDDELQNSLIYNTRVVSVNVGVGNPPKYRGKVSINTEDPKGTLHINSINDVSTSTPFIIDNRDSVSIISRNYNNENNTVFKNAIGSLNLKFNSSSIELLIRDANTSNSSIYPKLYIDGTNFNQSGRINKDTTILTLQSNANDNLIIQTHKYMGGTSGNIISNDTFIIRDINGSDWITNKYHDSFSIDNWHSSPGQPHDPSPNGGTLTFIERHPYNRTFAFGSEDRYVLNIDSTINKRIGINVKQPNYTLDILGKNINDGGPIINLKNEQSNINVNQFSSGIILDINKTSVNRIFVGMRQDDNTFSISNFESGTYEPYLKISNIGDLYLDKLQVDNSSNMALFKLANNKIVYRDITNSVNISTSSTDGLMSSTDKQKLDKFKFVGWVNVGDVNGNTVSVGSSYTYGGQLSGAVRQNHTNPTIRITFPNMGTSSYYLKFTVQSLGGGTNQMQSDNDITQPIFQIISSTQAYISITEVASTGQNIRIIVEGHLY